MEQPTGTRFVAISPNRRAWATGTTLEAAKAACKRFGGTLAHVVVFRLPEYATNVHVDPFGAVRWAWPDGYTGPKSVTLEVAYSRGVKLD